MATRRVVPFKRALKKRAVGPDVLGMKRALVKAKCLYQKPGTRLTNQFGAATEAAVKKFQKQNKLATDGIYGIRTHRPLMKHFDAYGALLMSRGPGELAVLSTRQKILSEALWGYNNRSGIHYAQVRPYSDKGHRLPQTLDCSSFSTVCYKRAGASDPNGFLFNGLGYTGTLSQRGIFVALSQAKIGDLVFYGRGWPWQHVAIYAGFGKVVSHGSEGGPYLCNIDYRRDRGAIRSYLP